MRTNQITKSIWISFSFSRMNSILINRKFCTRSHQQTISASLYPPVQFQKEAHASFGQPSGSYECQKFIAGFDKSVSSFQFGVGQIPVWLYRPALKKYILSKSLIQTATQGFIYPTQKKFSRPLKSKIILKYANWK